MNITLSLRFSLNCKSNNKKYLFWLSIQGSHPYFTYSNFYNENNRVSLPMVIVHLVALTDRLNIWLN